MTYNKKIVNKASITKKSLWSLVLAAKERSYSRENEDSSVSIAKIIGKNEYRFTYNLNTQVISRCNFLLNNCVINERFVAAPSHITPVILIPKRYVLINISCNILHVHVNTHITNTCTCNY